MFKTFSFGLALLAGLLGPTQAGRVPMSSVSPMSPASTHALARSASEDAPLDAIGPPPLAECALGCKPPATQPDRAAPGRSPRAEPAGLALVAVAALAGLLVRRVHRAPPRQTQANADAALLDAETSAPNSVFTVAPSSGFNALSDCVDAAEAPDTPRA